MKGENIPKTAEILTFGSIIYNTVTGELTNTDGDHLTLRRQSADVLAVLASNAGVLVNKETLIDSVWPGIATTDDSLVQCIGDIRRVLGRGAVDTFPKKGYRLNAVIPEPSVQPMRGGISQRWLVAFCAVALITAAMATMSTVLVDEDEPKISNVNEAPAKTLAVLPFTDLGQDGSTKFFSDGLGEDLTTDLSQVEGLTVISYASSLGYPEVESGFRNISEELGADYLVRGTIRQQGTRFRINVSLVNPADGITIWSERYDRSVDSPFDVQAQIAKQVVEALALKLDVQPLERKVDPDAYKMLMRGYERQRESTVEAYDSARVYFKRAIAFDPEYARAHASIAVTFGRRAMSNGVSAGRREDIDMGLQAAVTAIQLDPKLPLAYFSVGLLNLALGDIENALAAARHAIGLDSNFADGYALLAETSLLGGDLNEALYSIRRAKLLHPHHPPSYTWIEGSILHQLNRFEDAHGLLIESVELNTEFLAGKVTLAANYVRLGKIDKARNLIEELKINDKYVSYKSTLDTIPFRIMNRKTTLLNSLSQIR